MELAQHGRNIRMGKKYCIAINAVQDTTAGWGLPMKENCNTKAKPTAEPGRCSAACAGLLPATLLFGGGHPSWAGGGRKQQQPRQGEKKQKSANKLKSVTPVPALTSSILLLLPLWQRRFPAQKAARPLPENAGKRERELALQGKRTPFSSRSPSLFICPQLLAIWPRR